MSLCRMGFELFLLFWAFASGVSVVAVNPKLSAATMVDAMQWSDGAIVVAGQSRGTTSWNLRLFVSRDLGATFAPLAEQVLGGGSFSRDLFCMSQNKVNGSFAFVGTDLLLRNTSDSGVSNVQFSILRQFQGETAFLRSFNNGLVVGTNIVFNTFPFTSDGGGTWNSTQSVPAAGSLVGLFYR
jgi:hypothetical protein